MLKYLSTIITLAMLLVGVTANAENANVPIEYFSRSTEYSQVKISPKGDYLAVVTKPEGKSVLAILDMKTFKMIHAVQFPGNAQVGSYSWVNKERVVIAKEYLRGWQDHPQYHGELFGINADGSKGEYLAGYKGQEAKASRIKSGAESLLGTSYILDPLVNNRRKMLIVTYPWTNSSDPHTIVYEVDVYSGKRKMITRSPSRMASFLTDHKGNVRVAVSTDDEFEQHFYTRKLANGEWQKADLGQNVFQDVSLHTFDQSGDLVYVTASTEGGTKGLYTMNINTNEFTLMFRDEHVSPKNIWVDEISKELYAIETELDYPTYSFINNESTKSNELKSLLEVLQGEQVQLVSSTLDGKISVVYASSDTNSGDYYLFNSKTNSLGRLFSSMSWLPAQQMAQTNPINFETRDGQTIYGYLTIPNNVETKNLPLVVMPHGGPHGPRDWWGFDSEAQLLASRGIAVLKVNFRGSGGYSRNFERSGYRKWGSEIQFDIIDGVKHLIAQGSVNKDRICIMGASFGGYSALQSAILEPDMFKCAIGVVGVYDLPLMFSKGDVAERAMGQTYLKRVLGTDQDNLKAFSPSYNIDKLKAPVLIVHGGEDQRAPIEQAESLIAALNKANHPYIYELLEDEGHGFYRPEHKLRYYEQVIKFLDVHLNL